MNHICRDIGMHLYKVSLKLKDDVQSVMRSLSPQCLGASHDGMQIDVIRYEPLTLSLRRILNSF